MAAADVAIALLIARSLPTLDADMARSKSMHSMTSVASILDFRISGRTFLLKMEMYSGNYGLRAGTNTAKRSWATAQRKSGGKLFMIGYILMHLSRLLKRLIIRKMSELKLAIPMTCLEQIMRPIADACSKKQAGTLSKLRLQMTKALT